MNFQTNLEDLSLQEQVEKLQSLHHDFIRIKTGDALVNSQYVEVLLKVLCDLFRPFGLKIDPNDLFSPNHSKETLGQLKNTLKGEGLLNGDFIDKLEKYVKNRNKFVHGLYFHTFYKDGNTEAVGSPESEEYINFCNNLTEEGSYIIETAIGIYAVLAQKFKDKSPEFIEILNNFNSHMPDAYKALRDDFENKMKQKGSLPL